MLLEMKWNKHAAVNWFIFSPTDSVSLFFSFFRMKTREFRSAACKCNRYETFFITNRIEFHEILFFTPLASARQWIEIKSINIYSAETSIKHFRCNLNNKFSATSRSMGIRAIATGETSSCCGAGRRKTLSSLRIYKHIAHSWRRMQSYV